FCLQRGREKTHASRVATWPVEAGDEAELHRIVPHREHDRNGRGCRFGRKGGVNTDRGDYCCVTVSQIGRERRQPIGLLFSPAVSDGDVATLAVAEFVQPFLESGNKPCSVRG